MTLDTLASQLLVNGSDQQVTAATALIELLCAGKVSEEEIRKYDFVQRFANFLGNDDDPMQFQAVCAISNIAAGDKGGQVSASLVQHSIPSGLVRLLDDRFYLNIRGQAAWALGNIADTSVNHRCLLLRAGAAPGILTLISALFSALQMQQQPEEILEGMTLSLQAGVRAFANFSRHLPEELRREINQGIHLMVNLVSCKDEEVLTYACTALACLLEECSEGQRQVVIDAGAVPALVQLLRDNSSQVKLCVPRAALALGSIVAGTDIQAQVVVDAGGLEALRLLLLCHAHLMSTLELVSWPIANMTANTTDPRIQHIMLSGIIPAMLARVSTLGEGTKEVNNYHLDFARVIRNCTYGLDPRANVEAIVGWGCLEALCKLLNSTDDDVVRVALGGLLRIMKVGELSKLMGVNPYAQRLHACGGLSIIWNLQGHIDDSNDAFIGNARNIIRTYFNPDLGPSEAVGPALYDSDGSEMSMDEPNAEDAAPEGVMEGMGLQADPAVEQQLENLFGKLELGSRADAQNLGA